MADDKGSRLALSALGACVGVVVTAPLALIAGLAFSLLAGSTPMDHDPTGGLATVGTRTLLGLPEGVLAGLAVLLIGAGAGALVGRAWAHRPRIPKETS